MSAALLCGCSRQAGGQAGERAGRHVGMSKLQLLRVLMPPPPPSLLRMLCLLCLLLAVATAVVALLKPAAGALTSALDQNPRFRFRLGG